MKRELSSRLTFVAKIVMPGLWVLVWLVITLTALVGVDRRTAPPPLLFFVLGAVGTAIIYFAVMRYMKVSVDETFLYVSNYSKEIRIPLSDIGDVTEIVWLRGHPVTIHLKRRSEFGSKVRFTPKSQGFRFLSPHPVVGELKALAERNGSAQRA